ncbi:LacI family DNA-binding transcriptional regulator [Peribacillus loiseleuriae]|uniref:LacI family DNA-binding transcriptional regulator n=1 Tax=Peribacillus loiseleuriae TaxID=1679170 RepID=UPI003D08A812
MVSIKDIAKQAGVSISTVSYALNGSSKITEATTARIQEIAKELNYVPNAAARSLKKRETKIIGAFLMANYNGNFWGPLLQGINDTLNNTDYELIVCNGIKSHRFLPEQVIDGAVVLDWSFSDEELINYANLGCKLVVLDRELDHPNINRVILDNTTGSTLAVNYVLEKGHRKLYIVTGPEISYDATQRLQAVRQTVKHYDNIQYQEIIGDFSKPSGAHAAARIVQEYKEPVAVFCLNDEMAIGMYDYLSATTYQVGKHIHIIGFDNIEMSQYIMPNLATIDYSKHKWGAVAAENLLKLIANKPVSNMTLDVSLIKRESAQKR